MPHVHRGPAMTARRMERPGRFVRHKNETPMANLFMAMLDRMDIPVETLGDGTGRLGYLSDL